MHTINMTIIGTDTSLFNSVIQGISQFQLAGGERLDILIKFDNIPQIISNVYVLCYDDYETINSFVVKEIFTLKSDTINNKYKDPLTFNSIPLPFTNLSNVPPSNISTIRMRALFSRPV